MQTQQQTRIAHYTRLVEQPAWYADVRLHNDRVMDLALLIAARHGMPMEDRAMLAWAASWHDVGKLDVGAALVNKAGPLDEREWELMRRHPRYGALRAWRMGAPRAVVAMIEAHHERWDGRGYGKGLARHAIPLGAQVISLADVFDAMTSERPYKGPMTVEAALAQMEAERERAFNPELLEIALELFARLPLRVLTA